MSVLGIRAALAAANIESPALPDGRREVRSTYVTFAGTNELESGLHAPVYIVEAYVKAEGLEDPEATLETFGAEVREALQAGLDAGGLHTPGGISETERIDPEISGNIAVQIPIMWPA